MPAENRNNERLRLYESKAVEYVADKKKASSLLQLAMQKVFKNSGALKGFLDKLELLLALFKDWINGEYKDVPKRSLILLVAGLLYFVTPPDMVPDFIPVAGFLDDATVIGFIVNQISKDLDKYREWREKRTKDLGMVQEGEQIP
ncbi:MAG: YkvA family protein [Desulfitobacterium hafniense]|nr:YkvA family protein [Desulfitobacterium hafniense]